MAKVCPFLSYYDVLLVPPLTLSVCIESNCQLWDHENERCGMMTSDIGIHNHSQHHHVKEHLAAASFVAVVGAPTHMDNSRPTIDPDQYEEPPENPEDDPGLYPGYLMKEYSYEKDADHNGLIYGTDFEISDPPKILQGFQYSSDWPSGLTSYTMAQYILTIP